MAKEEKKRKKTVTTSEMNAGIKIVMKEKLTSQIALIGYGLRIPSEEVGSMTAWISVP